MIRSPETDMIFADREAQNEEDKNSYGLWSTLSWFVLLLVLTSLVGFILALAVFLMTFMRIRAGLSWTMALVYTVCGNGLMCFMAWMLNKDFPPGLLQDWLTLPWPLT